MNYQQKIEEKTIKIEQECILSYYDTLVHGKHNASIKITLELLKIKYNAVKKVISKRHHQKTKNG